MTLHHTDDPGVRAKDIANGEEMRVWKATGDAKLSDQAGRIAYRQALTELAGVSAFDPERCNFPVYAPQGGGYARKTEDGGFVFIVSPPSFPELKVGACVPSAWDIQPANKPARQELNKDQFSDDFISEV